MTNTRLILYFRLAILLSGIAFLSLAIVQWNSSEVIVEWSTETELNTVGFNILRSTTPEGETIKVNTEIIQSSSDPLVGGNYEYLDTTTEANQEYFYYLEEITNSGIGDRHGPIHVIAKGKSIYWLITAIGLLGMLGISIIPSHRRENA